MPKNANVICEGSLRGCKDCSYKRRERLLHWHYQEYFIVVEWRFVTIFSIHTLMFLKQACQKLFLPTVRKDCSSDQGKLLKFEAEDH